MDEKVLKTMEELKRNQFKAAYFETAKEAVDYLMTVIPEKASVGIGGSMTVNSIGVIDRLKERGNAVLFHWLAGSWEEGHKIRREALAADIYVTSTNALTMDGKLVNIDGIGNRVAGMFYGPKKSYIVCGVNKITENVDTALKRVKSIVHVNCTRLGMDTPCVKTKKCVDCKVPQRACSITTIIDWKPMLTDIEVVIINETLGY
jgi:L-lactate utilization protein LutB